ncbi:hypothetical protein D3C72_1723630 [compost metagenome]
MDLPAQRFEAKPGAAFQAPFSVEQDLRDMRRQVQMRIPGGWIALAGVTMLVAAGAWLVAPWWRRSRARLHAAFAAERRRWLASERHAAFALRRALARPDGRLDALYLWLRRSRGAVSVAQATRDLNPALQRPGAEALRDIYGPAPDAPRAIRQLRRAVPQWRRAFRQTSAQARASGLLPLNPGAPGARGRSPAGTDRQ